MPTYNVYEVWSRSTPEFKRRIVAKNSDSAKRNFLKSKGIRPSDYFCGLSNTSAKKIKD